MVIGPEGGVRLMREEEQFDSFYLKTRRPLVHQAFALTGDLAAAQKAVRDAYVAAWHHWRKVKHTEDARDWVRPRAWAQAQRRHSARLWQRTKGLSPEHKAALDGLHTLSLAERRAVVMVQVAGVPLDVGARELGITQAALERLLQSGSAKLAVALDTDSAGLRVPLAALAEAAHGVALPRPGAVRREGRRRRRTHTVVAAAAMTSLAVGSGAFAHQSPSESAEEGSTLVAPAEPEPTTTVPPADEFTLPTADDLLQPTDLERILPSGRWRITATHHNTTGQGLNYVCQQSRFADPEGVATLVRTLSNRRRPAASVVHTVEISADETDGAQTFDTVLAWFAGCTSEDLQLREAFTVGGVGDRATILLFQERGRPRASYAVSLAEVSQVVTTAVVRTVGQEPVGALGSARLLSAVTERLCERLEDALCTGRPEVRPATPPPSGESPPGILSTVDLPALTRVRHPWVGTKTVPAPRNPAATTCDRAQFRGAGAVRSRTRTFLVPDAALPDRFGLTQTYGVFDSPGAAAEFLATVRRRVAACEDRNLATDVLAPHEVRTGKLVGSTWRLQTELSETSEVYFDIGFVRRGAAVAQLTFVPASADDLSTRDFRDLLIRAGERLGELQ